MKNLKTTIIATICIVCLNSCSSNATVSPSQNEALNSVTNSTAKKDNEGTMQKTLDGWLKDEWTPKVEKDEAIKAKNQDKTRDFKLQEYVEKSEVYMKESNSTTKDSHYKKMESMPVIGK
jgi:hypothetical protein